VKKQTVLSPYYYSISNPEGLNVLKLHVALFSIVIICFLLSSLAGAEIYVENFNYAKPDQNDFINGLFHHSIEELPPMDLPIWDISDEWSPPDGTALNLRPALDEITFDLEPGEYIDHFSIDIISWTTDTNCVAYYDIYFDDFTTQGETIIQCMPGHGWLSADPGNIRDVYFGCDRIEIYKVILSSSEGGYDNLTINVVPEPATLLLFGLGATFLRKRR